MFFTIDNDNEIIAHATAPAAQDGTVLFATEKEFNKVTAEWPISRLVELWNSFAGVAGMFGDLKPVKKFENKIKATRRIWAAIQKLAVEPVAPPAPAAKPAEVPAAKPKEPKAEKPTRAKTPAGEPKAPREGTAKATVLAMIQRNGGATLEEIGIATGWQKHTIRGFMSTAPKKAGLTVTSTRRQDGARVYEA